MSAADRDPETTADDGADTPAAYAANPDDAGVGATDADDTVHEATIVEEPPTDFTTDDKARVDEELIVEDDAPVLVEPGDAIVVEDDAASASDAATLDDVVIEQEPAHTSDSEPVLATPEPGAARTEAAPPPEAQPQQVVYVQAPVPPKKLGNRGVGILVALLATVVFIAAVAVVTAIILAAGSSAVGLGFLAQAQFYISALVFVVAFVLLVLVLNRAGWWAYIIGSLLVGIAVYFGTIGLGLLLNGVISNTADEAAARFNAQLVNPYVIASALIAREVTLWFGAILGRRGRRLKARNIERRDEYERELAERRSLA